ncbi:hypothetical protein DL96DRAFT_1714110 [Flagelloscypha sp. PMI_526]|nr:hypothetical protein DL96DRAFT_1714110 [Flagelloscypha sp. PMI_526]
MSFQTLPAMPPPPARPPSVSMFNQLKDVNLDGTPEHGGPRKPLESINGHQLMSIFPTQPNNPELRPGPTSNYFERQERAFFAHGNELKSVQLHLEAKSSDPNSRHASSRGSFEDNGAQHWRSPTPVLPRRQDSPTPLFYPRPGARGPSNRPAPPSASYSPPMNAFPPVREHPTPPPSHHAPSRVARHPSPSGSSHALSSEEHPDEDDNWRRPMPHSERRRAGKHTKRIVVR